MIRCDGCAAWKARGSGGGGWCHRRAPARSRGDAMWPETDAGDFCLEAVALGESLLVTDEGVVPLSAASEADRAGLLEHLTAVRKEKG